MPLFIFPRYHKKLSCILKTPVNSARRSWRGKTVSIVVQLKLKGQWAKWCSLVRMDLSWNSFLSPSPSLLSFCHGATHNTISSQSNLYTIHKTHCDQSWIKATGFYKKQSWSFTFSIWLFVAVWSYRQQVSDSLIYCL